MRRCSANRARGRSSMRRTCWGTARRICACRSARSARAASRRYSRRPSPPVVHNEQKHGARLEMTEESKTVAQNRKPRHNYFIEETLEAGLMLVGSEVKSLRGGRASIAEAFAAEKEGEL